MKYKDYYAILGVPRDAAADDVKKAYRKLAKQYHPDVSKEKNAEERFKEINEAHETLSDPEKRAAYDQLGQYRPGEEIRPPPGWGREFRFEQGDFDGFMDLSIFSSTWAPPASAAAPGVAHARGGAASPCGARTMRSPRTSPWKRCSAARSSTSTSRRPR
jgi:curved DNA-binding protein